MKIIKIFGTTLVMLLTLIAVGCQESSFISLKDYSKEYYTIFSNVETLIHDEFYTEVVDMLNVNNFDLEYAHEDFIMHMQNLIDEIDQALYQLSILGPKIEDEKLQKHQSKLEFALQDYMNVVKTYKSAETFNVLIPIQYTLYSDMYEFLNESSPLLLKINSEQLAIESYLKKQTISGPFEYYENKQTNMYRHNYLYVVLGSHVSTYQSYSGLQVDPKTSNIISLSSSNQYKIAELDPGVMSNLEKYVTASLELINEYEQVFNLKELKIGNTLLGYIETYQKYFKLRAIHPQNFFKKNQFVKYTIFESYTTDSPTWWGVKNVIQQFNFDPIYEDTHHFIEMSEYYDQLSNLIKMEYHSKNMMME